MTPSVPKLCGENSRRVANCGDACRDGLDHHGPGTDCGLRPDGSKKNRPGADPAIGTNGNGIEVLQVGSLDIAVVRPAMLALAAGDHDTGCNLGSFSDIDTAQDAIRPDVDTGAHLGLSMRKEGSELNAGAQIAAGKREPVIANAEIITGQPRSQGANLSPEIENIGMRPKALRAASGSAKNRKKALRKALARRRIMRGRFASAGP